MMKTFMLRGTLLAAALMFAACGGGAKKCTSNADCSAGESCNAMSGTCQIGGTGGGEGGGTGLGGGTGTGGGGGTGGGTATGGGGGSTTVTGGETCELAADIGAGSTAGTTVGAANHYSPPCTGYLNPGPDVVYKVSVPAGQRVKVTATPGAAMNSLQYDLSLYLVRAPAANCNAVGADGGAAIMCLAGADDDTRLDAVETGSWYNDSTAAVDIFIIVDSGFGMTEAATDGGIGVANEGPFTLDVAFSSPAAGDRCDTAITLASGTALTNQDLADFGDDYQGAGTQCDGSRSPDVAYVVTVPAGQVLTLTVTPSAMFDPVVSIADGAAACDMTCLDSADNAGSGRDESLIYKNTSSASQTIYVVVDGYNGSTGTFSILATVATPPADDVCSGATTLTAGTPLSAQTTVGYANDYESGTGTVGCATSGTVGGDRVYSLQVPVGQRAAVTVTPAPGADGGVGSFSPSVSLVAAPAATCDAMPRACVGGISAGSTPRVATFYNTGSAAAGLFAIVDSASTAGGSFSIGFTAATPAADDTCTTATTTLTAGTPLASQDLASFTLDYPTGTGCASNLSGVERVYRLAVANNQTVTITATPTDTSTTAGPNLAMNLYASAATCEVAPRTCVANGNSTGRGAVETIRRTNVSGATENLLLAVADTVAGTATRTFALSATTAAVMTGEVCQVPQALTGAGTTAGLDWAGFSRDYVVAFASTTCEFYSGPERVFSISVPAGQTLTATATPDTGSMADPVINLIDGPASNCTNTPTCLDSSDDPQNDQAPETVTFQNTTAAAKTVFIVVGSYSTGPFSLTVALQ